MSLELCRLCLSKNNLKPIFPDIDQSEKFTTVLALTTGLNIQLNDGLPQQICEECTEEVNNFLKFRSQAHISESELLKLGFQYTEPSTVEENKEEEKYDYLDVISTDCYDFESFKIEVELDRISQNGKENGEPSESADPGEVRSKKKNRKEVSQYGEEKENPTESAASGKDQNMIQILQNGGGEEHEEPIASANSEMVQPKRKSKKEMRQMYLSLVEGEFVPNEPVKCKICKKYFNKWKYFINHAKKHLDTEKEIEFDRIKQDSKEIRESTEPIDTESAVERKKKSRKEMRKLYMSFVEGELVPNGPVKCKICKKTLNKWNSFINHARKHIGFKIVCEFCGKSFVSSNQLKRHCRSFHGMERDLKCKHCNYLALDTAQLRLHERRVHTGERPFVCDTCAAAYFSRKCLLQHIESHRTTASVQCGKCPLTFKSRRHLAKHVYGTHSDKRRERRRERRQATINKDAA